MTHSILNHLFIIAVVLLFRIHHPVCGLHVPPVVLPLHPLVVLHLVFIVGHPFVPRLRHDLRHPVVAPSRHHVRLLNRVHPQNLVVRFLLQ